MAQYKLVLNEPKTGKSKQLEVKDNDATAFVGKKIREQLKGEAFGLSGYEVEITGGSDNAGFPMRAGISGIRKVIYTEGGVGAKPKGNGTLQRKRVCGDTINATTSQINLKVLKMGTKNIFVEEKKEEAAAEGEAPKEGEAKPAEAPKAEEKPKEEPKAEEKKTEEKPAEGDNK
jgi:small subunit ribosomal protein S6e